MTIDLMRSAGWAAFANAALSVAILLTLILMFAVHPIFGPINDLISVFWALSFVPIVLVLARQIWPNGSRIATIVPTVAIGAMLLFAFLQLLLVLQVVRFEQTFMTVVTLGASMGLALLIMGWQARGAPALPSLLGTLIALYGLSYALSGAGIWLGGQQHPLAIGGYLVGALVGPVWAVWLGRIWLSDATAVVAPG